MANHALPTTTSTYANFVSELQARIDDAVKENSTATITLTNPPANLIRWNDTNKYWEINTGTPAAPTWAARSSRYDININGTVGATTANTGAFTTLSTSGIASLGASSTVGGVAITTASNTQTLTNKTLTLPVIASISNGGTVTIPSGAGTLVTLAAAQTLTSKTLTAPRMSTGTAITDANGVNLVKFPTTVTSAVNYITVNNTVTAVDPSIQAEGTDVNIGLDLKSKGTGLVEANGVPVATTTGTQTLTNKTLTLPVISSFSNGGTVVIPSGADTLVNLAGAQVLTNKTLTAPKVSTGTAITDANGVNLIKFPTTVASAVNYLDVNNTITGADPNIQAAGPGADIGLDLRSKGTGLVEVNGVPVVTTTGTQTLTSKTLTGAAINGTVGATTPSTGVFTTLTANTSLSVTGTATATTFAGAGTSLTGTAASLSIGGNAATASTCSGNAGTVTNGVYTTGAQTITGVKTFSSTPDFASTDATYVYAFTVGTRVVRKVISTNALELTNAGSTIVTLTLGNTGDLTAAGNITAYSDRNLKTDIKQINNALDKLKSLTGYTYTRIDTGERQTGLLAQDVQVVLPEAVVQGKHLSLAYGNLVGLLVEAIKELNAKVDALK